MRPWSSRIRNDAARDRSARKPLTCEALENRCLLAGLVQPAELEYLGAFNVPRGASGSSTFEYGGTALAFNPARNSLFLVGHDWQQAVGEISIPIPGTGPLSQLPTASVLQPLTPVLPRIPDNPLSGSVKIGGLMVTGNALVGTAYVYYDANGAAEASHFTLSSLDLRDATVSGMHQVGQQGAGFVAGYMTEVPPQWRDELGTRYLTGQAALSIIGRTSVGPAAYGFDPARLGAGVTPATPLLSYTLTHPLARETTQNPLFNTTTEIRGVVFPEGTDSVLFVGSHGTGPYWYGEWYEGGVDHYRPDKGPHAPDYVYQVWAYDAHDLAAVKQGRLQPWQVRPYDTWQFDLPYFEGGKHIGGVAYDADSGRLYVSQQFGNQAYPVIHVYQVNHDSPKVNDAPRLDTARQPELPVVVSSAANPAGTPVATLLDGVFHDPDPNARRGIAVTAASDYRGAWQFSLNAGRTWQGMDAQGDSAARLLPAWAEVRVIPNGQHLGTAQLYYRAWDQTQGTAGKLFSIAQTGGKSAFSHAKETAAVTIVAADAPRLLLSGAIGYVRDEPAVTLAPWAEVRDRNSSTFAGGQLRVQITAGDSAANRLLIGAGFSVDAADNLRRGATIVGKLLSSGWGTRDLTVTLNKLATLRVVEQLIRSIGFRTAGGSAGQRKVCFCLTDGEGLSSVVASKVVSVR